MSTKDKIVNELRAIFWVSLYFFTWFGALSLVKYLLLQEYNIDFSGLAVVLLGTVVAAKVVLILENVPLPWFSKKAAILEVLARSILYLLGAIVVLLLEKAIEARHDYGGFLGALKHITSHINFYHSAADIICVFGAIFIFNLASQLKNELGLDNFRGMFLSSRKNVNK